MNIDDETTIKSHVLVLIGALAALTRVAQRGHESRDAGAVELASAEFGVTIDMYKKEFPGSAKDDIDFAIQFLEYQSKRGEA